MTKTLHELLVERGADEHQLYQCPTCKGMHHPISIKADSVAEVTLTTLVMKNVASADELPREEAVEETTTTLMPVNAICVDCIIDTMRVEKVKREQVEIERIKRDEPWNSELGKHLKAERNRKIADTLWATDPATSPLSPQSRAAYTAYVKKLHRMSVDFAKPTDVVWPNPPAIEYA